MEATRIKINDTEVKEKLFPFLSGNVFHVTTTEAFIKIRKSGYINSNKNCNRYKINYPQSCNSYGNKNELVCLFDFRQKSYEEIEDCAKILLNPGNRPETEKVVYLLLNENSYKNLRLQGLNIPIEEYKKYAHVPKSECWYPKKISLEKISKVLIANIKYTKDRPLHELDKRRKALKLQTKKESLRDN